MRKFQRLAFFFKNLFTFVLFLYEKNTQIIVKVYVCSVGKLRFHLAHVVPDRSWFVGNVVVWPPANCNAVHLVNHDGFDALYIVTLAQLLWF